MSFDERSFESSILRADLFIFTTLRSGICFQADLRKNLSVAMQLRVNSCEPPRVASNDEGYSQSVGSLRIVFSFPFHKLLHFFKSASWRENAKPRLGLPRSLVSRCLTSASASAMRVVESRFPFTEISTRQPLLRFLLEAIKPMHDCIGLNSTQVQTGKRGFMRLYAGLRRILIRRKFAQGLVFTGFAGLRGMTQKC
jgi:hypothetical protein